MEQAMATEQSDIKRNGEIEKVGSNFGLDTFDFHQTWLLYLFKGEDLLDRLAAGSFVGMTHPFRFAILPFLIVFVVAWVLGKSDFSIELQNLKNEGLELVRFALVFLPGIVTYHLIRVGRIDSASISPLFYLIACFIGSLGFGFVALYGVTFLLQTAGAAWATFDILIFALVPYILFLMFRLVILSKNYYDRLSSARVNLALWSAFIVTALLINYVVGAGAFRHR